MDYQTRQEIMQAVKAAMQQVMEATDERWLTSKQLCEQFGMFSPSWLKMYGHMLPRTQATVTDERGREHVSSWAYPRNKIQRMIAEGRLDFNMQEQVEYRPSQGRRKKPAGEAVGTMAR